MSTSLNRDAAKFWFKIGIELLLLPILYAYEGFKKLVSSDKKLITRKQRLPVVSDKIHVSVHEWGGYELERQKTIKHGSTFVCGLKHQLSRFKQPVPNFEVDLTVTISDLERHGQLDYIQANANRVIGVSNAGMDFSGYATQYSRIKHLPNAYVILSNSSVEKDQQSFLEGYIDYMEAHPEVGIMGVSYCTKIYQSLVRNNFNPHIQSFFYLTTIEVLSEIVKRNGGSFPGQNITHKLLLIREAEVKVSQLALKLGYQLAVVQENGEVYQFGKNHAWDNGFRNWKLPYGDVRQINQWPNRINKIKNAG